MREEYERGQLLRINQQELDTEEWAQIKKSHPGIKYQELTTEEWAEIKKSHPKIYKNKI